jgi:hypothetical protein
MLATLIVLCFIAAAYWGLLLRFLVFAAVALLIVGAVQVVQALDGVVSVSPNHELACSADVAGQPLC